MLSKAQNKLILELCSGRVICEDWSGGKYFYTTAKIDDSLSHTYGFPRNVNKQTVWALMSDGLIEIKKVWNWHDNPKEVYVLSEKGLKLDLLCLRQGSI